MKTLSESRELLDAVDAEIMRLFAERAEISREIGEYKRIKGLPIGDPERENDVIASRVSMLPEELKEGGERLVRLLIEESKAVQKRGLNLYLIGMPDCGKTRTGKKLREITGLPLCDTDKLIMQKVGKTIDEIFDSAGESAFRVIESAVLRSVAARGGMIAALGGGTPLWGNNAALMKSSGFTVFLDRAPERLLGQNIANRPLLRGENQEEIDKKIMAQYLERHEKYLACADFSIDPDEDGAAGRILEGFRAFLKD